MPTSRERRIFSTNSASGRDTESRSAGSCGSGLGPDARCPGLQRFMITKDELGARVLHRSPLRRAPVAPSAQRQDHAQRPRVNQSRTRPDGLAIGPPGAGMPRAGAAPGIEIKHANLFRTIRCAARSRCIRAPLLPRYPHAYAGLTVSERGGGQAGCRAALFCRRHRPMP